MATPCKASIQIPKEPEMSSKPKLIIASVLLSIFMIEPAFANSIRCGTHLITAGDSGPGMYEVLKRCGEPTARYGKTWVYDKSNSPVSNILHFDGSGQLYRIEKG
jgi:hypothetical protein